jgi:hypothetical protein
VTPHEVMRRIATVFTLVAVISGLPSGASPQSVPKEKTRMSDPTNDGGKRWNEGQIEMTFRRSK